MKTDAAALLQQIYGQQAAVGVNGSTITSVYLASPVASFKANHASFACYISTTTGVSPGVDCTMQVTASKTDGSTYEDVAGCGYDGLGLVEQCTFPSTWTNVAKLSFQIVTSEILQEVSPSLGGLLGELIGFIVDNFKVDYNCVAGKINFVVAPGLCGWVEILGGDKVRGEERGEGEMGKCGMGEMGRSGIRSKSAGGCREAEPRDERR